jgi:hypothetical protein
MIILKIHRIISSVFFILLFYSCKGQLKANDSCTETFKTARALAYANSTSQSTLDSALNLINECMECDSIKKAVVDFKITLLVSMKKYSEGIKFIDSLKEEDFTFGYKKKFMSKGLQALEFNSVNDTAKRNFVYREMADDIEEYIEKKSLTDKEFKEIYTDLFAIKEHYLDAAHVNNEVEILKNKYPGKQSFFDFFKK